jgi:hypothetical protein
MSPGDPQANAVRTLAMSMVLGGLFTIGLAVYLGSAVSSALYLIALVGLVDFVVAWAFASGKIGPLAQRRREAEASGDAASLAQGDPSYNPYARED